MYTERDDLRTAQNLWRYANPNYCIACQGVGAHPFQGHNGETDYDPCNACVTVGLCPVCGGTNKVHEQFIVDCEHCGWAMGNPGMPYAGDGQ